MTASRLDALCEINPETLNPGTAAAFRFRYLDISAVTTGVIDWDATRIVSFGDAPSRARRLLQAGDILLCTVRPGLQAHARIHNTGTDTLVASTGFAVLRPVESGDSGFIFHQLFSEHISAQLRALETGSNYPAVNERDLHSLMLFAPNSQERIRIASLLDTLDLAIAQTDAVIAKLKQIRTGLLHDLLTRGLDENGQLRDPIAHPEQFNDSPLGRIPNAWTFTRMGVFAQQITSGSRGWAAHYASDGPLFLRIGNLTREHINLRLNDVVRVQPPSDAEGTRTKTSPGDILISITADLGIIGVVPESLPEAYVNQHIAMVRPAHGLVSRWLGRYLASGPAAKQFQLLNDSGAKAGMNLSTVGSLMIALPSETEQAAASSIFDDIDRTIGDEEESLTKFVRLKSGLMSDLLTGRVRVPDLLDTDT